MPHKVLIIALGLFAEGCEIFRHIWHHRDHHSVLGHLLATNLTPSKVAPIVRKLIYLLPGIDALGCLVKCGIQLCLSLFQLILRQNAFFNLVVHQNLFKLLFSEG